MTAKTNTFENKLVDAIYRAQPLVIGAQQLQWVNTAGAPAVNAPTYYIGLLNTGAWVASAAVSTGTFIVRPDASGTLHLLKCTTAGTTGASAPTAPSANDGTVNDGSVVWTDQYTALEAGVSGNLPGEFTGGTYARQPIVASLANMAGTQSAGSTTASTGSGGTTSNNNVLTFNGGTGGNCGLFAWYDASTSGNMLEYGFITGGSVPVASGATLTFAAAALTVQEDN